MAIFKILYKKWYFFKTKDDPNCTIFKNPRTPLGAHATCKLPNLEKILAPPPLDCSVQVF